MRSSKTYAVATTNSAWMPILGIGFRRSLLNSPAPSEQRVYSVVLALSPVNATDPPQLRLSIESARQLLEDVDFMAHVQRFDHIGITVADLASITAFRSSSD